MTNKLFWLPEGPSCQENKQKKRNIGKHVSRTWKLREGLKGTITLGPAHVVAAVAQGSFVFIDGAQCQINVV